MPFYSRLRTKDYTHRATDRLLALRRQIARDLPKRTIDRTLLLASWNLRDFDNNKFKHGPRLPESLFYIAEVISAFDLVAVQEVSGDLRALREVMRILGPSWDYLVTDVTEGASGNGERMAFLYDTRKVWFKNLAGQIVLPKGKGVVDREVLDANGKVVRIERQFARTPFLCSFQAGWFKFSLCTVHLYYGADSGAKLQRRIKEIQAIAKHIASRAKKERSNFFVLGDFNIVSPEHDTMKALLDEGFEIPPELRDDPSNIWKNKHYDQIAFRGRESGQILGQGKLNAGVFDPFKSVFRSADAATYVPQMPADKIAGLSAAAKKKYFRKEWRTFQISDHLPMWIELQIDFSDRYLKTLRTRAAD